MSRTRYSRLFFLLLGAQSAWAPLSMAAPQEGDDSLRPSRRAVVSGAEAPVSPLEQLLERTEQGETVRIIVRLELPFQAEGLLTADGVEAQRWAIARAQDRVAAALDRLAFDDIIRYRYTPHLAMTVDAVGLERLMSHPDVASIHPDRLNRPLLMDSTDIVQATLAHERTYRGLGQTVAILDTGVDGAHSFLAGAVQSEACYSEDDPGNDIFTLCPNGQESQTGAGAGVPCTGIDGCDHGTHVAGITAGDGTNFDGVAPYAGLIAVQVFSEIDDVMACDGAAPCLGAFDSSLMSALDRVYALRSSYSIASINMSLGGGMFTSSCDSEPIKSNIDNLKSAGIATVIASGNNGFTNAVSYPACVSSAVAVGATTKADGFPWYTNMGQGVDLLAPGHDITSSVPGNAFDAMDGTSMAAPHVAGAFAVMKSKVPGGSVDSILSALQATGTNLRDARTNNNPVTKPRINLDDALTRIALGFGAPTTWSTGFAANAWSVSRHPRMLADVNADGRQDMVGFGDAGVYVALSNGSSFGAMQLWSNSFGYTAGWRIDKHPRILADVNGDRRADIVGFFDAGTYLALSTGTGFGPSSLVVNNFGYNQTWRVESHPRFLADVTADGRADIVGFGWDDVQVAVSNGTGFNPVASWNTNYCFNDSWAVDRHPRVMADVNGDRRADIVGFGDAGTYVSISTGGSFSAASLWSTSFGYNNASGGWRVERHPRLLADMNADGRADIVGFGEAGVYISYISGSAFTAPGAVKIANFGAGAAGGSWEIARHPRMTADVDGDGRQDVVGFGDAGTLIARSTGTGLDPVVYGSYLYGYGALSGGWRTETHPRLLGDLNNDGRADVIGCGDSATYGALSR